MVYPHSNDIGKEKPKPKTAVLHYWSEPNSLPSSYDMYKQMLQEFEPAKPKTIQPDIPVYSQQAHALRIDLKVEGFGLKEPRITAQWMVSNEHIYKQGGIPVDQAEKMLDAMLAGIKNNIMEQIKENAK